MSDHGSRLFRALDTSKAANSALLKSRLPWYYVRKIKIDPPFAHMLDDQEIIDCADWFTQTTDDPFIGDSGFIAISMVAELIISNQIERVVQLGHYAGFSSMIIGMMLKKVSPKARLISFDIDARMTNFCDALMVKTRLDDIVRHVCIDSTDPITPTLAGLHLEGAPGLVFIDASKQYHNTITEIGMWSQYTTGYCVAHDVSVVAKGDQANGVLGVSDGLIDSQRFAPHELLLLDPHTELRDGFPYLDPCGLGVGVMRGAEELPRTDRAFQDLVSERRILEPTKLDQSENWFLGESFALEPGKLVKTAGHESWATCYVPIQAGETLQCELTLSGAADSQVMVCAGGGTGTSVVFSGDGSHRGEFVAGEENSLVGILASADSTFVLENLRVH